VNALTPARYLPTPEGWTAELTKHLAKISKTNNWTGGPDSIHTSAPINYTGEKE